MRLVDFAIVRALSSPKSFFPRPSEGNRDAVAVLTIVLTIALSMQ
jgi:hypothetical protein